jgi:hypothetical protein
MISPIVSCKIHDIFYPLDSFMERQMRRPNLKALGRMKAIERAVLADRYSVYFDNGKEVFVTAKSNEAAEKKASRIVPGVKIRFSLALDVADFLRCI